MPPVVTRTVLLITGMRNNSCREAVAEALSIVSGVREVHVTLYRAWATVTHEASCAPRDLIDAVARAGYTAALGKDGRETPR